ncbi:SusD/RagB family nutrient-binding outer membrane lipoprotein [uncultured Algibacter sp.]|uniref:SusD/RagB family nutrient-binding outer membrane lipoprotein n=1 Tax=uncultured Algibacter sp. TaxID=298659 RepID=UPI00263437BA|nr:SusD/RagB family nutrient-binding outer membrane lipoprotein [uncultured Algibacter sp.]
MKNFKYYSILLLFMTMIMSYSCSDSYIDVNDSTTNPPSSTPDLTLVVAQKQTADMFYNANNAGNAFHLLGGIYAGVISDSGDRVWYDTEQQYFINTDTYQSLWNNTYTLPLSNYDYVENFEGIEFDNYKAVAKIMKAYHFATLVDQYGDIPYSEAFARGLNPRPTYDDDEAIYDDLYNELNIAIAMINNAPPETTAIANDAIMGGNMQRWQQFANTLKLRILIKQANLSKDLSAEYSEIMNNGIGFITSTVAVNPGYADQVNQQNPFWSLHGFTPGSTTAPQRNGGATRGSETYINFMTDNLDPRVSRLFLPASSDGELRGVPQNVYETQFDTSNTSELGPALLNSPDQDAQLMLGSEALFLQAEAVHRGLMPGNAGDLYRSGIEASFTEMGVAAPATAAAAYELNSNNIINWDLAVANGNELEAIITQKWVAGGFITGFEVWMDRVRTNFPSFIPLPVDAVSPIFPSNLLYPTREFSTNSDNVPEQGTNAAFDRRTFWMQ